MDFSLAPVSMSKVAKDLDFVQKSLLTVSIVSDVHSLTGIKKNKYSTN